MTNRLDPDVLCEALLRLADDPAQLGSIRAEARLSSYEPADLEVDSLNEETLVAALRKQLLARADRRARPDDPAELQARLHPQ